MSTITKSRITKHDIPADIKWMFLRPPILATESRAEYDLLLESIATRIRPDNSIEWLIVRDIVNFSWGQRRQEKFKAELINMMFKDAAVVVLDPLLEGDPATRKHTAEKHADQWLRGDFDKGPLEDLLRAHGLSVHSISTYAMTMCLPQLELIEREMHRLNVMKMDALRDLEHYRGAGTWDIQDLPQITEVAANSTSLVPKSAEGGSK
jgi:hypothetical protein